MVKACGQVVALLEDERKTLEALENERATEMCTDKKMIGAKEAAHNGGLVL